MYGKGYKALRQSPSRGCPCRHSVQRVSALADLKVKAVDAFPYNCGEWEWVDSLPDFTVQFVDALPDITIEFVDAFPGRP